MADKNLTAVLYKQGDIRLVSSFYIYVCHAVFFISFRSYCMIIQKY